MIQKESGLRIRTMLTNDMNVEWFKNLELLIEDVLAGAKAVLFQVGFHKVDLTPASGHSAGNILSKLRYFFVCCAIVGSSFFETVSADDRQGMTHWPECHWSSVNLQRFSSRIQGRKHWSFDVQRFNSKAMLHTNPSDGINFLFNEQFATIDGFLVHVLRLGLKLCIRLFQ
jgi:hypothetical protein